jgi:hypothetical protein
MCLLCQSLHVPQANWHLGLLFVRVYQLIFNCIKRTLQLTKYQLTKFLMSLNREFLYITYNFFNFINILILFKLKSYFKKYKFNLISQLYINYKLLSQNYNIIILNLKITEEYKI